VPVSVLCDELLDVAFPHLESVLVERVSVEGGVVRVSARTHDGVGLPCPDCGTVSCRVHSRYQRHLADLAVGGRSVVIDLSVRRLFCDAPYCPRRTFVEQVEGLSRRYCRYTPGLLEVLGKAGLALAGSAGARLLGWLHVLISRVTVLAWVMRLPMPTVVGPRVLGVDDFAFRRSYRWGTILVDMADRRPIDMLPDREADTLAAWLRDHPGVEVICRDRAGAYADGARTGAPTAIQVADRFHLWKNVCEVVQKTVTAHHGCLRPAPVAEPAGLPAVPAAQVPDPLDPVAVLPRPERRLTTRTRLRFEAVQTRLAAGMSRSAIGRELNLGRRTVRRFADAPSLDVLLVRCENRTTKLDGYLDDVHRLWNSGTTNAAAITEHLRPLGFTGDVQAVRRYVRAFRLPGGSPQRPDPTRVRPAPIEPVVPKPRKISKWILSHPDHLDDDETMAIKELLGRCEHLQRLDEHVRSFAAIMTGLRGTEITGWIERVEADDLPHLTSFATGLRRDIDAVVNGLSLPHSSGAVEGAVCRIKMLKRQCYGQAGFPLLPVRVLLA